MAEKPTVKIEVERDLKVKPKAVGGSDRDQWNERLLNLAIRALPVDQKNSETVSDVGSAVVAGLVDMQPADPIEGMLMSQLVVVNEAALKMYRLAWLNNAEYFEASTKYLQLADKATRTVAILTERLDQHRGRGQQHIVVKHVTVNADQAVVTDTVVTGKPVPSPALLTDAAEKPMPTLAETSKFELVGVEKRNEHQPHAKGSCRSAVQSEIKRTGKPCRRLEGLPDARGSRWCANGQAERKLSARGPVEGNSRALEAHQIASLTDVRFRTIADKVGFWPAEVCPLMTQSGHAPPRASDRLSGQSAGLYG